MVEVSTSSLSLSVFCDLAIFERLGAAYIGSPVQMPRPFQHNDARQAVHALAGYAYGLYQTLSAWLRLEPDQLLCVEVPKRMRWRLLNV